MISYFILFVSGLFLGSFLNLVSDRLEEGGSILFGRSKCMLCGKQLTSKELFPVISFIVQRGKCAGCKKPIGFFYPFSEVLTGVVYASLGWWLRIGSFPTPESWAVLLFYLVVASFLLVILFSDIKFMTIPDKVVFPASLLVLLGQLALAGSFVYSTWKGLNASDFGKYMIKVGFLNYHAERLLKDVGFNVLTGLGVAAFFALLILVTRGRGMGGGDVKLGFLLGLLNGFPNAIVGIFIGFLTGALYSVILIVARRKSLGSVIPFGPFLILGGFLALLFGSQIFEWYIHLL